MKGFCETCRDTVEFTVKEEPKSKSIQGKDITYKAKVAYCDECKKELFVSELRDYNLKTLDSSFKSSKN